MKGRIAVLLHEADRNRDLSPYVVDLYARFWKEDGLDVRYVYGPGFVPADVAILHVDLSVVPDEYLALARRYPVALNGHIADVRKSTTSRIRTGPGDDWSGPVIVKTDLNHAGLPEYELAQRRSPAWRRFARHVARRFAQRHAYRVYASIDAVPRAALRDPRLVVERFLAERDGDRYCVRLYQFLGDRHTSARVVSAEPVIKAAGAWTSHPIEPDPGIVALRHELGYEFGKFDYVMLDGEAVLLDANKTPGGALLPPTPERMSRWRDRARGILSFL